MNLFCYFSGITVTVVMPKSAQMNKQGRCEDLGATLLLHGKDFCDAKKKALAISEERDMLYLSG